MAVRLLEYPPTYCSACWCAQPEKRHVDYASDNDQGYGGKDAFDDGVAYDNLQLCEDCMKAGAQLVGMVDAAERDQEIAKLKTENDRLEREARQAINYADRLEDAFEHRAQPVEIDHRRKPRHIHPQEALSG
jgi:hypothetical protein